MFLNTSNYIYSKPISFNNHITHKINFSYDMMKAVEILYKCVRGPTNRPKKPSCLVHTVICWQKQPHQPSKFEKHFLCKCQGLEPL